MPVAQDRSPVRGPAPLKERLLAWWSGDDVAMPARRPSPARPPAARKPAAPAAAPARETLVEPLAPWENPAMRIEQLAWGEGCSKPGGSDYFLELSRPLGLDATKSILEFGTGLGGGARALRHNTGVWIEGYELEPELARAARQLAIRGRMEKGVDIACYSPQDFAPRPGGYDCILSRETLYRIENKEDLLVKFEQALKPRGHLMITDFVLTPGTSAKDPKLKAFGSGPLAFWPTEHYVRHFRERNFDLRINEDITATYRKLVLDGCKRFSEGEPRLVGHAKAYPSETVTFLDQWAKRVMAFDAGLLKVMRFSALKSGNIKLMSDW
jgi:cyclopropane fatty-acyl-phospholipid synthase-like methyltransferase